MSRRRSCCAQSNTGAHACYPCPDPISPYTATQWAVEIYVNGIKGESDGSGALGTGGVVLDCQRGSCGSTEFKEKAVGNDTYAMGYCDPVTYCEAMRDQPADKNYGSSRLEWTTCKNVDGEEDVNSPYYPNIENSYSDHVRILYVGAQSHFANCGWTAAGFGETDCRSVVLVRYTFTNYFEYSFFEDAGPGQHCYQNVASINTTQSWECAYSKRPNPNEWLAEGQYALVRVEYPTAAHTLGPVNQTCSIPGGTVCSANGLTPVTSPTQWQPPATVTVVRVA